MTGLTLAQQGAHVGIWEWHVATGEMYWSAECERLYDLEPGTLKTFDDWRSRVHPDDLALLDLQWTQQIEKHLPFEVEYRLFTHSGDTRWLLSKGQATYDDMGKPACLSGVNLDISDRKHA